MTKTYIKNKGTTTLMSSIPNHGYYSQDNYNKIDWDIDYDGSRANIEMDINSNGKTKHLDYELTNEDLENILNMPSFRMPLEERLIHDFPLQEENFIMAPKIREKMLVLPVHEPKRIKFNRRAIEPLIKSLKIKKIKPRYQKSIVSSLRKRLTTPRPKTMRVILRPKSSSRRTNSRR